MARLVAVVLVAGMLAITVPTLFVALIWVARQL
jgi:hypothetical protein